MKNEKSIEMIETPKTKHFIRIDEKSYVLKGFSEAFEPPNETDICIQEDGGRHFEVNNIINPPLFGEQTEPLYKWDGVGIIETTQEERQAYINNLPSQPKTEVELLKETIEQLREIVAYQEVQNRL